MACGDFYDLTGRTASDEKFASADDKVFNITKNPKYDGCHRRLVSMVYKIFDKKTAGGAVKNEIMQK